MTTTRTRTRKITAGSALGATLLAMLTAGSGATSAIAADGELSSWPESTGTPISWQVADATSPSGVTNWTAEPRATGGSVASQVSCEAGLFASVYLSATTAYGAPEAPALYENDRAGGTIEVIAVTPTGDEVLGSWVAPAEDQVISTRDDMQAHVTDFPATPGQINATPGVPIGDGESRETVTAPALAVWPSQARGVDATTGGDRGWPVGIGSAVAYVQADPTDPEGPSAGAPSTWHIEWDVDLPDDATATVLRLTQFDGQVIEATSPTDPLPTWCGVTAQDHIVTVPLGETAELDLLTGATTQGFDAGLGALEVTTSAESTTVEALHLTVDGRHATHTPEAVGTYAYAYTATATGPLGLQAAGTVTVVVTDASIVTVPDRTVEVTVGETAVIDLLEGTTATTAAVDDLAFGATVDGDVPSFLAATGWTRTGRSATVTPIAAGAHTVTVWAADAAGGYGAGRLTIIAVEPKVEVPVVTPEPEITVPPEVTPEPEVVVPPVVTPAPEATPTPVAMPEAPVAVPEVRIETGLPDAKAPATGHGELSALAGLLAAAIAGLTVAGAARRSRREQ